MPGACVFGLALASGIEVQGMGCSGTEQGTLGPLN